MRWQREEFCPDILHDAVFAEFFILDPAVFKTLAGIDWGISFITVMVVVLNHLCPQKGLYTLLQGPDVNVHI